MIALEEQNEGSKNCLLIDSEGYQNGDRCLNMKQGMMCCEGFAMEL